MVSLSRHFFSDLWLGSVVLGWNDMDAMLENGPFK